MNGNVHTVQGQGHGNTGGDHGELADQRGLLIIQCNHLNDVSAFTGSKMQSIAVCCQSPPGAMRTHVTKQQILLQIVHHVFSRGC